MRKGTKNDISHFLVPEHPVEHYHPPLTEHTAPAERPLNIGSGARIGNSGHFCFFTFARYRFIHRCQSLLSVCTCIQVNHGQRPMRLVSPQLLPMAISATMGTLNSSFFGATSSITWRSARAIPSASSVSTSYTSSS